MISNISRNEGNVHLIKIRQILVYVVIVAFCFQIIIDNSFENIMSSLLAAITSLITFMTVIRREFIRRFPVIVFIALSPASSFALGPLLFQTLEFNPIVFNLQSPLITFHIVAYFQISILIAFYIFVSSRLTTGLSSLLRIKLWRPLSLFKYPRNSQLWLMGAIGIIALIARANSTISGGIETGDSSAKFLDAFRIFAYAPFLIPILSYLEKGKEEHRLYSVNALISYFIFLLLVSVALNSRAAFATGIANLLFLFLFLYLDGQINLTKRIKLILASSLVTGILILPVISDLATAMVMVRGDRYEVEAIEMLGKTFDTFQDKEAIESYRKIQDLTTGSNEYNENYLNNPFLSRFVNIKFADNILSYDFIQEQSKATDILSFNLGTLIALAPQPLINMFSSDFDKNEYAQSFGDVVYALAYHSGFGSYKLGSVTGNLYGIFGYGFIFMFIPILLFLFIIVNSFNYVSTTGFVIAPIVMIVFIQLYYLLINDNFVQILGYIFRVIPQNIALYLLLYWATNHTVFKK